MALGGSTLAVLQLKPAWEVRVPRHRERPELAQSTAVDCSLDCTFPGGSPSHVEAPPHFWAMLPGPITPGTWSNQL